MKTYEVIPIRRILRTKIMLLSILTQSISMNCMPMGMGMQVVEYFLRKRTGEIHVSLKSQEILTAKG